MKLRLYNLSVISSFIAVAMISSCSTNKSNIQAQSSNSVATTPTVTAPDKGAGKISTMPIKQEIIQLDSVSVMKLNGNWTLRSINGHTLSADKGDSEDNRPFINFDARTGKFYANGGCNTINGDFRANQANKLDINLVLTTMMLCPDAKYEQEFKMGLANTASFRREQKDDENILTLLNSKGSVIMTLVRPQTDFLNGSWTVTAINGMKNENEKVRMVIDIPEGKVHGNAGCNIFNGAIFVDPDKGGSIQFQEIGITRMLCPDIETETAFLLALESVEFARQSANGDALLMNSKHQTVITLSPLNIKDK